MLVEVSESPSPHPYRGESTPPLAYGTAVDSSLGLVKAKSLHSSFTCLKLSAYTSALGFSWSVGTFSQPSSREDFDAV